MRCVGTIGKLKWKKIIVREVFYSDGKGYSDGYGDTIVKRKALRSHNKPECMHSENCYLDEIIMFYWFCYECYTQSTRNL